MVHTVDQLVLANACHPSMDDRERWRRMHGVVQAHNDWYWAWRLHSTRHRGSPPTLAMEMLDAYENRRHQSVSPWVMSLVILVACWWYMRQGKKKDHAYMNTWDKTLWIIACLAALMIVAYRQHHCTKPAVEHYVEADFERPCRVAVHPKKHEMPLRALSFT